MRYLIVTAVVLLFAGSVAALDEETKKPFVTSLTIYPTGLMGEPHRDAGEVLGLLLEQNGFLKIHMAEGTFTPRKDATFDEVAASFGSFVKKGKSESDYALYAEILGSRKEGIQEIRGVMVDRKGAVVWKESKTTKDPAFKKQKPDCPMDCCVFLSQQLTPTLILAPMSERGKEGPMARMWAEKSGVPDPKVYEAMEERVAKMKKTGAEATVVVFPVRKGKSTDREGAEQLVSMLNKEKLCRARVAEEPLWFEVKRNSNEQRILWDMAKAFQAHMRKNAPDADYALYGDYWISPGGDKVGVVHFAVCDRKGDWVIVDYQNSHHDDFQTIKPGSLEDCNRLVQRRLIGYLR